MNNLQYKILQTCMINFISSLGLLNYPNDPTNQDNHSLSELLGFKLNPKIAYLICRQRLRVKIALDKSPLKHFFLLIFFFSVALCVRSPLPPVLCRRISFFTWLIFPNLEVMENSLGIYFIWTF